ncbi:unnamed protein product [Malus baccata var. baccata]
MEQQNQPLHVLMLPLLVRPRHSDAHLGTVIVPRWHPHHLPPHQAHPSSPQPMLSLLCPLPNPSLRVNP